MPADDVRRSIHLRLIRHAESENNQVYREARKLYAGGTPEFDLDGWTTYVDKKRKGDPSLSDIGFEQADCLSKFLVPNLLNQSTSPVRIITSPMKRTIETIRPTLEGLTTEEKKINNNNNDENNKCESKVKIIVNGFYFETEGMHLRGTPQEGMSPSDIGDILKDSTTSMIDYVGFPGEDRGWYYHGKGAESRAEAEERATKFFIWLCDYLDTELDNNDNNCDDVYDAGVQLPEEEHECDSDKISVKRRKRRNVILIGHGDFMSLVLKRIITGFGHYVENEGIPHRSAFVHYNTGITELEYFGNGRFLLMSSNQTPHFTMNGNDNGSLKSLRTGGHLKDGWSYLVPNDKFVLDSEVSIAFNDEELSEHEKEQTKALKSLYLLKSSSNVELHSSTLYDTIIEDRDGHSSLDEEQQQQPNEQHDANNEIHFVVKRGLQVVGCATLDRQRCLLKDIAVKPSATTTQKVSKIQGVKDANTGKTEDVVETLLNNVKNYIKDQNNKSNKYERKPVRRSSSLIIQTNSGQQELKQVLKGLGFEEQQEDAKL